MEPDAEIEVDPQAEVAALDSEAQAPESDAEIEPVPDPLVPEPGIEIVEEVEAIAPEAPVLEPEPESEIDTVSSEKLNQSNLTLRLRSPQNLRQAPQNP